MKIKHTFLFILLLPAMIFATPHDEREPEIKINNRILATVNGNTISALDVMKKMDLFLRQSYPEYANDLNNRYQFFTSNWKHTLSQIINNQLMLADAEKLEMKILEGEIREELHERFGPNVMATLDDLNITYEEAWQMIYADMAVQRMTWYRVQSKSLQEIGPADIKKAYDKYLTINPPKEEWKYQVLSIRSATEKLGTLVAQRAQTLLSGGEHIPFETLAKQLEESGKIDPEVTIKVSDEYNVEGKNLSASHLAVLRSLKPNSYSQPISQVSRFDKSIVHRIFYLVDHVKNPPPKFHSMVDKLHDELVQDKINAQFPEYITKLRKRFNISESEIYDNLPPDFEPFILQ